VVREFGPTKDIIEFFLEANSENERGTVRGILLVWGAMTETTLREFIFAKDPGQYKKKKGNFEHPGFHALIEIANKDGHLTPEFIIDLTSIKEIRNCAAHEWRLNLENKAVRAIIPHFETLRLRYFDDLWHPSTELLHISRQFYAPACMALITAMHSRL
jgi:hypothetical protein